MVEGRVRADVDVDEAPGAGILEGVLTPSEQGHGAEQHAEEPDAEEEHPVGEAEGGEGQRGKPRRGGV